MTHLLANPEVGMHGIQTARLRSALRALRAAARLAFLYGISVVTLIALLFLWTGDWPGSIVIALTYQVPVLLALPLSLLLLLAVFRRLGFVLAWIALALLWIVGPYRWIPVGVLAGFVFWSVLALPLYLTCVVGFRDPSTRRALVTPAGAVAVAWLCFLGFTLAITPVEHLCINGAIDGVFGEPSAAILRQARHVWGLAPFLIAGQGIATVLREPVRFILGRSHERYDCQSI